MVASRRAARRSQRARQALESAQVQLVALTAASAALAVLNVLAGSLFPVLSLVIVLMIGGFWLRFRPLLILLIVVACAMIFISATAEIPPKLGHWLVLAVAAVLMLTFAWRREVLGVQGIVGETMLIDLRDRLRAQGTIPPLPRPWRVQTTLQPAYGDSFSGDFLVSSLTPDAGTLRLALVDVSGKGQGAGTRALLLSGALGGLIGAMPPAQFLPAANGYLLQQRWDEGFATAVHLSLELASGRFRMASAGHPPAAHYHRGSGHWEVLERDSGPALGLIGGADFPVFEGLLLPGDALMMFTDGVVERPDVDVDVGIDYLIGQAERVVTSGFRPGSADWLVQASAGDTGDDRALVLVWRSDQGYVLSPPDRLSGGW